jgi:ABC-2 type transport system permease protein
MPSTVGFLMVATIPALIAFGLGAGLGLLYHVLGVLFIVLTPLFGISVGALVAIFMVRLLPARRLNEWVGAAAIVIGVLLSLILYLPTMLGADQGGPDAATLASMEQIVNQVGDLPLPSMWAGRALVEMGQGQIAASALGATGVYLLLTLGLFLVTILVANHLYLSGWLRMQSSGSAAQDFEERPGMFGRASLDFTLGYKDWLLRIRDPRLLATLFTAIVFAGISVFFILRPGGDGSSLLAPAGDPAMAQGGLGILSTGVILAGVIYFAGWMMFYRTAITALSIERSAFYILKTAPVSASRLLRAKASGIVLPYAIMTTLALAVSLFLFDLSPIWTPFGWLVLLIMGYGLFSYLVSVGFLYPNLEWDDPRRMISRKAGLPALIGSFVYSLGAVVVAMLTYVLGHGSAALAIPTVVLGLSLLAGGTWLFVHWCTRRVERAWPQIGAS